MGSEREVFTREFKTKRMEEKKTAVLSVNLGTFCRPTLEYEWSSKEFVRRRILYEEHDKVSRIGNAR